MLNDFGENHDVIVPIALINLRQKAEVNPYMTARERYRRSNRVPRKSQGIDRTAFTEEMVNGVSLETRPHIKNSEGLRPSGLPFIDKFQDLAAENGDAFSVILQVGIALSISTPGKKFQDVRAMEFN